MLANTAPCLQRLAVDLYDTGASQAADVALHAVGDRLSTLELQLYGGAVLPCDGIRSCTGLKELRLQLSMDRKMHIGPFKYGSQPYTTSVQRRRRGDGDFMPLTAARISTASRDGAGVVKAERPSHRGAAIVDSGGWNGDGGGDGNNRPGKICGQGRWGLRHCRIWVTHDME